MSDEMESKVKSILSGWVTPVVTIFISVMISLIGFFAKNAFSVTQDNQKEIVSKLDKINERLNNKDVEMATFSGRIVELEKFKAKSETEHETFYNELEDIKLKMAINAK